MTLPANPTLHQVAAELGQPAPGFIMERLDERGLAQVSTTPGSAYTMASLAGKTCENRIVNIGTNGFSYGFNSGAYGAMDLAVIKGVSVTAIHRVISGGFPRLDLILNAAVPQNYLYALLMRNSAAPISGSLPDFVFVTSAADFINPNPATWRWSSPDLSNWPGLVGNNVGVQAVY